jgi:hypothetical protein
MTEQEIKNINRKCPSNQGIFFQPSMVPVHIKEHVIYRRYKTSGYRGGSCWGTKPERVDFDDVDDGFIVLDLTLEKLMPNITYLKYKQILKLIHTNEETDYEYYGNSTEWKVEYIILSELENFLNNL